MDAGVLTIIVTACFSARDSRFDVDLDLTQISLGSVQETREDAPAAKRDEYNRTRSKDGVHIVLYGRRTRLLTVCSSSSVSVRYNR